MGGDRLRPCPEDPLSTPHTIAIVGAGRVSAFQRVALSRLPGIFRLVGLCDTDPTARAAVRDLPVFSSLSALLREQSPDAVVVATPNQEHAQVAHEALDAGCAVLIEKPATTTVADLQALIAHADRVGCPLHTAFHAAAAPDVRWVADRRAELAARFGPVTSLWAGYFDDYISAGQLAAPARSLGGSWVDLGINALSALDRLVDDLDVTDRRHTPAPGLAIADQQTTATLTFAVGAQRKGGSGVLETSWALGLNRKSTVLTCADSGARIVLHHSHHRVRVQLPDGRSDSLLDAHTRERRLNIHYQAVFEDFAQVLAGRPDNRERSLRLHRLLYGGE